MHDLPFTFAALRAAYVQGTRPESVIDEAYRRIDAADDPGIFISLADREHALAQARALGDFDPGRPLWGLPFAVKDNIDIADMPTTAACPSFAYAAKRDAFVVSRLRAAGAIPIGKTNLDQFATGLVGTRTPYPVPRNAMDAALIPGGSSSGSAVAVARGLVSFALGTDTAGSGRVPAGLNNIVGLKPSLGAISTTGVVPACRSLDAVSIMALTVEDAYTAFAQASGEDTEDPWSRSVPVMPLSPCPPCLRVGVPDASSLVFGDDALQASAFERDVSRLAELGAEVVELDFGVFFEVARLLYEGAWVAERHAVVEELMQRDPEALHPVTATIIGAARNITATDAFRDQYRLKSVQRGARAILASVDMLCVPTAPTVFTTADLAADPYQPNAFLGTYTNFVNLLGLCGLTVPTAARDDGRPASVTLLATHGRDHQLAALGRILESDPARTLGATGWPSPPPPTDSGEAAPPGPHEFLIAVCGAHMSGLPLNPELTERGGRFVRCAMTAPCYRLFALEGTPPRPGLVRVSKGGASIALELWALPRDAVGDFLAGVPSPLGIGTLALEDGESVQGFLCEAEGASGAQDVTRFGGWREVVAATRRASAAG